jgi:enoyl-CoA hydratase
VITVDAERALAGVRATVDGDVGVLELDAPPLNLLTDGLRAALVDALADFRARGVRAVLLGGRGRAFCAGADLKDEAKLTPDSARAFLAADEEVFSALSGYPGGVVAAINGYAYGGGLELALACDIRLAARSARLAAVGVTIGLVVSSARLARLAGEPVAKDLLLSGRPVDAAEALDLGLVSRVVDDEALGAEALEWARTIASRAPLSVRANKACLGHCQRLPLADAVAYERGEWARLQRTADHAEALRAFFEKRPPQFTAR